MCLYTTHVRVCYLCSNEDLVLISEKLCQEAEAGGVFGSCANGPLSQRDQSRYYCWGCKEYMKAGTKTTKRRQVAFR